MSWTVITAEQVTAAMAEHGSIARAAAALGLTAAAFDKRMERHPHLRAACQEGRRRHVDAGRPHGTEKRYATGCRCDPCRHAHNDANAAWRAARRAKPVPDHVHGQNGYSNYGCRCPTCREAHTKACTDRYRRRRNATTPVPATQKADAS